MAAQTREQGRYLSGRPPYWFIDERQHGPFRRWRHEHAFMATAQGATTMTDIVQFRSPLGILGTVADRLVLDHYMAHLLRQRKTWLKITLEARG